MTRVAVIGTAGRKTAADRLDWPTFLLMRDAVLAELHNIPRPWELVSGAAAWADHVAVDLFLGRKVDRLELHLPCRFNGAIFYGDSDEARTANHYHREFTARMPPLRSSFTDLREAIARGATIWQYEVEGFKARNYAVGRVMLSLLSPSVAGQRLRMVGRLTLGGTPPHRPKFTFLLPSCSGQSPRSRSCSEQKEEACLTTSEASTTWARVGYA